MLAFQSLRYSRHLNPLISLHSSSIIGIAVFRCRSLVTNFLIVALTPFLPSSSVPFLCGPDLQTTPWLSILSTSTPIKSLDHASAPFTLGFGRGTLTNIYVGVTMQQIAFCFSFFLVRVLRYLCRVMDSHMCNHADTLDLAGIHRKRVVPAFEYGSCRPRGPVVQFSMLQEWKALLSPIKLIEGS